jgi:DNA transformation protein
VSIVKKTRKAALGRAKRRTAAGKRQANKLIPMRVSDGFRSFVVDQLDGLGEVTARSMFGGVGLYSAGSFFGIIAADVLYLKVDDATRADYERAGSKPFRPYAHRAGTMQYWSVPIEVLESAHELAVWARKAVAVAGTGVRSPAARRRV